MSLRSAKQLSNGFWQSIKRAVKVQHDNSVDEYNEEVSRCVSSMHGETRLLLQYIVQRADTKCHVTTIMEGVPDTNSSDRAKPLMQFLSCIINCHVLSTMFVSCRWANNIVL